MRRLASLLTLCLLAIPRLGMAQSMTTLGDSVRVRLVAPDSTRPVTLRLVGSGAPVRVLSLHALTADTLVASTPLDLLLPSGVFRLVVTTLSAEQDAVLVYDVP